MTGPARRVALLVRPGEVADRLRELLAGAGIDNVLQGDPAELAVDMLADARPQIVLVALDPDMEDALERFDAVLGNPDVNVIYEEAELAAVREGWEAARWKRHLLAKLQGHDQVLPPRPEGTPEEPAGLRMQTTPEISDEAYAAFDPHADKGMAVDTGDESSPGMAEPAPLPPPIPSLQAADQDVNVIEPVDFEGSFEVSFDTASDPESDGLTLDIGDDDVDLAIGDDVDALELVDSGQGGAGQTGFEISFDPVNAEEADEGGLESSAGAGGGFEIIFDDAAMAAPSPEAGPPPGLDEHLGSLPAAPAAESRGPAEPPPLPAVGGNAAEPPPLPGDDKPVTSSFGELTLDDGNGSYQTADTKAGDERFGRDLADLDARIASLGLVEEAADGVQIPGVVLVLAGIGGPDAVRQFLGALPTDFPRPILVQQRLDGGRYDRLVAQMQRATTLPVHLGEPGRVVMDGFVYVLPAGLGIEASANGTRFVADTDILEALPSGDSAIVMLSGSEPASVDAVLKHRSAGALVAGQSPQGCYDPTAPDQLAARGGELLPPAEIAQRLAERWAA